MKIFTPIDKRKIFRVCLVASLVLFPLQYAVGDNANSRTEEPRAQVRSSATGLQSEYKEGHCGGTNGCSCMSGIATSTQRSCFTQGSFGSPSTNCCSQDRCNANGACVAVAIPENQMQADCTKSEQCDGGCFLDGAASPENTYDIQTCGSCSVFTGPGCIGNTVGSKNCVLSSGKKAYCHPMTPCADGPLNMSGQCGVQCDCQESLTMGTSSQIGESGFVPVE